MKVTGTITKVLETKTGTSKAGKEWSKLDFILETTEEYNNLYCLGIFGAEKVEKFLQYNKVGNEVDVEFNVSCNEFEGKYYTSLNAWKVFKAATDEDAQPEGEPDAGSDDLPF